MKQLRNCIPRYRRPFLVSIVIVCFSSLLFSSGQEKGLSAPEKTSINSRSLVQLNVCDFSLAETKEQRAYYTELQQSIPDTLYLHFITNPRLQVSRNRAVCDAKSNLARGSSVENDDQGKNNIYTLAGSITPVGSSSDISQGTHAAHHLFILQYQVWEQASPITKPQPKGPPESMAISTTEVLDTLDTIAQHIIDLLVPSQQLTLSLTSFQVQGLPDPVQRFYKENLFSLVRSSLLQSGLVRLIDVAETGSYKLTESAVVRNDRCTIVAELKRPDSTIIKVAPVEGSSEQILELHERLTQNLIDALRIEARLAAAGETLSGSASDDEYVASAKNYEEIDPELAVALYRKALALNNSNKIARAGLASNLIVLDRPKEVLAILSIPQQPFDRLLRGIAYWRLKDNEHAREELRAALDLVPSSPLYYELAAKIFEDMEDYKLAIKALEDGARATGDKKLSSSVNETRRRVAAALIVQNKPAEALQFVLASLTAEPKSEWGQRIAGIAYFQMKDQGHAEEHLQKAMEIQPTALAAAQLGELRVAQQRYQEALTFSQRAISLDPEDSGGYDVLIMEIKARMQSDPNQAKIDAIKAVQQLKEFLAKHPSARASVIALDEIQILYVGASPAEVHELYQIYTRAVAGVSYSDWLPGWTNLVELAMLDRDYKRSAETANALLKIDLPATERLNMAFYSWLQDLLMGNCDQFKIHFSAFNDYTHRPELREAENDWSFEGTRGFIDAETRRGMFAPQALELVTSAMVLLESRPFTEKAAQAFGAESSHSTDACKPR